VSILNGVVCVCRLYVLWNWMRSTEYHRDRSKLSRSAFWEGEYEWHSYIRPRKKVCVAVTLWALISSKQFAILTGIPNFLRYTFTYSSIIEYQKELDRLHWSLWSSPVMIKFPTFFCRYITSRVKTALSNSSVIFYCIQTARIFLIRVPTN